MFCGNCGVENVNGAKICKDCGHPLIAMENKKTSIDGVCVVEKVKKLPPKYVISGLAVLVVLFVAIFVSNIMGKTINPDKAPIIETEGYDARNSEIEEVAAESMKKQTSDVEEDVVDISAYLDDNSKCYGGNLEECLAEKLGVKFEDGEDLDGFYEGHIDGDKIVITESINGTGYFVFYQEQIPSFYIFGTYPGMKEDEAKQALKSNGLVEEDGVFSDDINRYYISLKVKDGVVDGVTYVKCFQREF